MTTYEHWNDPSLLPPVECPLKIDIGISGPLRILSAERTAHIDNRNRDMTYKLMDGSLLTGRYPWTYP